MFNIIHFKLFMAYMFCPNRFMLLLGLDKEEYRAHTCLLYI